MIPPETHITIFDKRQVTCRIGNEFTILQLTPSPAVAVFDETMHCVGGGFLDPLFSHGNLPLECAGCQLVYPCKIKSPSTIPDDVWEAPFHDLVQYLFDHCTLESSYSE